MVTVGTNHDEGRDVGSNMNHGGSDGDNNTTDRVILSQEKVSTVEASQLEMLNESEDDSVFHTTRKDAQDMQRMGKTQQLVRQWTPLKITFFTGVLTCSWEFSLFYVTPALQNGGNPALMWTTIYQFFCCAPVFLSLSEMASMAPTAGAQYHWVSEFAPEQYQQGFSYIVGWLSTLAWQAGNASSALLVGTLIQVMISIGNPEYSSPVWHVVMLTIADIVLAYAANILGNKYLPNWQNIAFTIHLLAYLAVIIPIWVNAERATPSQVWTEFFNGGGWPNMTLTVLVGQLTAISSNVGLDSVVHMAEEVKNASRAVPLAMMSIYVVNFIITFVLYLTLSYHIPDSAVALDDSSHYPAIYVLKQSMSSNWLLALLAVTALMIVASNIVYLAAVSRDLYAFSRDRGLPFSSWLAKVDPNRHVPVNACFVSSIIAICLSLIYLGSSVAYYAITSLLTVALFACYISSILCVLWRRIVHPATLPPAQFSLGRWGVPINVLAIVWSAWAGFWCFWPTSFSVDASSFNWASPIFVFTFLFSIAYYFINGRRNYVAPVRLVEGRDIKIS